jgi:hypothetical protein
VCYYFEYMRVKNATPSVFNALLACLWCRVWCEKGDDEVMSWTMSTLGLVADLSEGEPLVHD